MRKMMHFSASSAVKKNFHCHLAGEKEYPLPPSLHFLLGKFMRSCTLKCGKRTRALFNSFSCFSFRTHEAPSEAGDAERDDGGAAHRGGHQAAGERVSIQHIFQFTPPKKKTFLCVLSIRRAKTVCFPSRPQPS